MPPPLEVLIDPASITGRLSRTPKSFYSLGLNELSDLIAEGESWTLSMEVPLDARENDSRKAAEVADTLVGVFERSGCPMAVLFSSEHFSFQAVLHLVSRGSVSDSGGGPGRVKLWFDVLQCRFLGD